MENPTIKDPLARKTHDDVHGIGPVLAHLKKIDDAAADILKDAKWSRAIEIRSHVIEMRNKIDDMVQDMVKFIKERDDVCKDCTKT